MKISVNRQRVIKGNTIAALFLGGIAWFVFCSILSIVWFIPYSVETWSVWFGKAYDLAWWQSVLIFFGLGMFFRKGAVYTSALVAFITLIMVWCGFAGFP